MYIWTATLKSAGLSGFFASRAFLSAFSFAMLARFGGEIPYLRENLLIQSLTNTPEWFTQDITLIILGILGSLELLADKIPEVREFMNTFDSYFKAVMATITAMGLLGESDAKFIAPMVQSGILDLVPALIIGAIVFGLASVRSQFLGFMREADSEDAFGIQGLISWAEDVWALFGPLIFILYPVPMIALTMAVFGGITWWVRHRENREEKLKISCQSCDTTMFRHAAECPKCHTANPTPHKVSLFGFSRKSVNDFPAAQPMELALKGRCPKCAEKLNGSSKEIACDTCGTNVFQDRIFYEKFMSQQRAKLPIALAICAAFSLIPVIGLIPGIIYYRLYLVAPFRRYLPASHSLLVRWGIRVLFFFLIALQWMPAVGGFVVPAMAWLSFESYRAAFVSRFRENTNPGQAIPATT